MTYEEVESWIEAQDWDFEEYEDYDEFIEEVKGMFRSESLIDQLAYEPHANQSQTDLQTFFEENKSNTTKEEV